MAGAWEILMLCAVVFLCVGGVWFYNQPPKERAGSVYEPQAHWLREWDER